MKVLLWFSKCSKVASSPYVLDFWVSAVDRSCKSEAMGACLAVLDFNVSYYISSASEKTSNSRRFHHKQRFITNVQELLLQIICQQLFVHDLHKIYRQGTSTEESCLSCARSPMKVLKWVQTDLLSGVAKHWTSRLGKSLNSEVHNFELK